MSSVFTQNYFNILQEEELEPIKDKKRDISYKKKPIDKFKKLNDLFKYYPHYKKLSDNYNAGKYILFPNPENFTKEMAEYYSNLIDDGEDGQPKNNNLANILSDYLKLHELRQQEIPNIFQKKLSDEKSRIILRTDILDNIPRQNDYDFSSNLSDFLYWLKKTYEPYMGKSIEEMNNKSKMFSFWSITHKKDESKAYDNFLLLKEIRKYQIRMYYTIYEAIKIYYVEKKNNLLDRYKELKQAYLTYLTNTYTTSEENKDLLEYNNKSKYFLLFNENIELLIDKFSKDCIYYEKSNIIFFNTISSSYYLKKYLYLIFDITSVDDTTKLQQNKTLELFKLIKADIDNLIIQHFTIIKDNVLFIKNVASERYVLSENFDIILKSILKAQFIHIYEKLEKIDIKFIIFLSHFIYYEITLLNDVDQLNTPIFSKKMHPKYIINDFYNISSGKLESDAIIAKPLLLLGHHQELNDYLLCAKDFIVMAMISDKFKYGKICDLVTYNPDINDMYSLAEILKKENMIKAIFINNAENKIDKFMLHTKENLEYFLNNYTYIGILQIMAKHSVRTQDILLCYHNTDKNYKLFDPIGIRLRWGTILYESRATYRELLHLHWWNYRFFSQINNLKYIYICDNKLDDSRYEEVYLDPPNYKISPLREHYLEFSKINPKQIVLEGGDNSIPIIKQENKKLVKYYNKFNSTFRNPDSIMSEKIKKFLSLYYPYDYFFSEQRTYYNCRKIVTNPINILNYKFRTIGSLFFVEINNKYNLIENNFTNIYEISNNTYIGESIIVINDKLHKNFKLKTFNIDYLTQSRELKNYHLDLQKNIKNNDFINIFSKNQLITEINKINNIDFLYINLTTYKHISSTIGNYISKLYLLYVFNLVKSKLNVNSNLCIVTNIITNYFSVKIITLICSLYEEYFITTPEINYDRTIIYIICKHKKNTFNLVLDKLQEIIIKNCPTMGINETYVVEKIENRDEIKKHITQFFKNETYIKDIDLENNKLYKKIKKELIIFNTNFYFNMYNLYKKIYHNIKHNIKYTEEEEKIFREKNLYACIQWSKKYEIPLIPEIDFDSFGEKIKIKILSDIVSFEQDIIINIKNHEKNIIEFKTNNDFDDIPKYFKRAIVKNNLETRALDYRPMNIYHQVKVKIDYYYKKLTKEITKKYKLSNEYISNAWLKMTELLNKVDLINKKVEKIKTFHICELPGSFINAIKFYINTKTNIKEFEWKAQSLNPNRKDTDERIAFGDEANMLKKYPENYDFGYNKSGDITDYKNIEYYRKNYNDNDFITSDCGLPFIQKNLGYILSYSQYLMIFSCCKIGGNCVLKKYVPIDNTQEIYMLYLFYCLFDKVIIYKPKLNYQSQEYYLCGLNYLGINNDLLDKLINFLKNYKLNGFSSDIPNNFVLQIDKAQHALLDNMNNFIKKKIYFCDNFDKLTETDWENINKNCKEKIKEWFESVNL